MRKQLHAAALGVLVAHGDATADRLPVAEPLRRMQLEHVGRLRYVVLPAAPRDRVALPEQPAVPGAELADHAGRRRDIERTRRDAIAAIEDVEEEPTVAPRRVDRPQDREVCRAGDASFAVGGRECDVRDHPVRRRGRIEGEVGRPAQQLVRAGIAERAPAVEWLRRVLDRPDAHRPSLPGSPRPCAKHVRHHAGPWGVPPPRVPLPPRPREARSPFGERRWGSGERGRGVG